MKQNNACPKCGQAEIVPNVQVVTGDDFTPGDRVALIKEGDPSALLFKKKEVSKLLAWVCATCGFAEFYAEDPKALMRAHKLKAQKAKQP